MSRAAEVIVIGSGLGGLSVAGLLAHAGREVLVLERAAFVGGRAHVVEKDGFMLDYGIHFSRFHKKGRLADVMRGAGGDPEFIMPGEPLVFKNDKFYKFPRGPVGFTRTDLISRRSKLKVLKFFFRIAVKRPHRYEDVTLADIMKKHNPAPDLVELTSLFASSALACPYPEVASMKEIRKFFEQVAQSPVEPLGYIKGGWKSYFDLMRDRIEKKGEIRTRCKVDRVVFRNGRAAGVEAAGETLKADAVVCAAPFQDVPAIIDEKFIGAELAEYSRRVEPTCGIILDFALKEPVSTIRGIVMTAEPMTMGCLVSNVDPALAPPGKQLGTWFQFIPSDRIKDREYVKKQQEGLVGLVGRIFPGVWDVCEWKRELVAPMIDGAMLKVGQTWSERAPLVAPGAPNLFFAGDTTCGIGAGGDIALDSALRSADLANKYLRSQ